MRIFYRDQYNTGTLVVLNIPKSRGQANLFFFRDPAPRGPTFIPGVVVQNVQYTQETNTQFQPGLGSLIYVHNFGDQMGSLNVTGLAFPRACQQPAVNGLKEVMSFYRDRRISASTGGNLLRVKVVFAEEVLVGFLTTMGLSTVDEESGVHQFQLGLRCMPQNFRLPAAGSSAPFGSVVLDYNGNVQRAGQQVESSVA